MLNSVDPDETAHYEPSHLDMCCFHKPIIIACGSERVKHNLFYINTDTIQWDSEQWSKTYTNPSQMALNIQNDIFI